jgi:hypothetical protein
MMFPGNGFRHDWPFMVVVVIGSKISPDRTGPPPHALVAPAIALPRYPEKFPVRAPAFGRDAMVVLEPPLVLYQSEFQKKKDLFLPL